MLQSFTVSYYVCFAKFSLHSRSSLKNFFEPLSSCIGNMNGRESSHVKEWKRSPLAAAGIAFGRPHLGCPVLHVERRTP